MHPVQAIQGEMRYEASLCTMHKARSGGMVLGRGGNPFAHANGPSLTSSLIRSDKRPGKNRNPPELQRWGEQGQYRGHCCL